MDEKNPDTMTEAQLAIDNIKKMFRLTMATNGRKPDETLEQCRARIAADPDTARVAGMLKCSVEDLMQGFGQQEQFHVPEGYNHDAAQAEVSAIMERVAALPVSIHEGDRGEDKRDSSGQQLGVLAAPKEGEKRSEIVASDAQSADALKASLQRSRSQFGALRTNKGDASAAKNKGEPAKPAAPKIPDPSKRKPR